MISANFLKPVLKAIKDLTANQADKVQEALQDLKAQEAIQELRALQVKLVHKDHKGQKVIKVIKETQDNLVMVVLLMIN